MDDFDFLHGSWSVANGRLSTPLGGPGPGTWGEFPGHSPVISGFTGDRGGFHGEDWELNRITDLSRTGSVGACASWNSVSTPCIPAPGRR